MKINILVYIFFSNFFVFGKVYAWGIETFKSELISPVTTDAAVPLYIGAGLTTLSLVFEDSIVDPLQEEAVNEKPLGSLSKIGDLNGQVIPNALYLIGQSIAGYSGNVNGYKRALGMFKATAYASLVTTTLKYSVREKRPNNGSERNSFPSGHTTTAFAFAGYILNEHGWAWGIPALGLASLTGFSRINDNRHYLHDVLAGATIGLSYGLGISMLESKEKSSAVSFVPLYGSELWGGFLTMSF